MGHKKEILGELSPKYESGEWERKANFLLSVLPFSSVFLMRPEIRVKLRTDGKEYETELFHFFMEKQKKIDKAKKVFFSARLASGKADGVRISEFSCMLVFDPPS